MGIIKFTLLKVIVLVVSLSALTAAFTLLNPHSVEMVITFISITTPCLLVLFWEDVTSSVEIEISPTREKANYPDPVKRRTAKTSSKKS